jgi:integrase
LKSYIAAAPDLAPSTVRKLKHHVNRFEKHTGCTLAVDVDMRVFSGFRRSCLQGELSPFKIEGTINDVMLLLKHAFAMGIIGNLPEVGRRLMRRAGFPVQPTIEEFENLYSSIRKADTQWPNLTGVDNATFWEVWLAVIYFTALRHEDSIRQLKWKNVDADSIRVLSQKTSTWVELPVHPVLWAHLEKMPRLGSEPRVFPVGKSPHLVRRELKRISNAAGLSNVVTPQQLRRLSATEYGKAGGPGCGSLITGHSMPKQVDVFYMDPLALLKGASERLYVPAPMRDDPRLSPATGSVVDPEPAPSVESDPESLQPAQTTGVLGWWLKRKASA